MQYKKIHCKSLYKLILEGDVLAAQEHLARHRDYGYDINPKIHSSPDRLLQLIFKKKHTSPSLTAIADFFTKNGIDIEAQMENGVAIKAHTENGIDIEAHEERALDLSNKKNYSRVKHHTLYKNMLEGNELATKEFIIRCKTLGYNINARINALKLSVLQIAVKRNLTSVATLLIDNGADINLPDKFGIIPLQDAIKNRNEILIKKIVQRQHSNAYMNQVKNNSSFYSPHSSLCSPPSKKFKHSHDTENALDLTTKNALDLTTNKK